jgi:hypothetical protein
MIKWRLKNQHHYAPYYGENLFMFCYYENILTGKDIYDIPESSCSEIIKIMMDYTLFKDFNIKAYLQSKRLY